MNEQELVMLIWGTGLLSITWTTIKTFKESNDESVVIKAIALVLTIALAPFLALLQGAYELKLL